MNKLREERLKNTENNGKEQNYSVRWFRSGESGGWKRDELLTLYQIVEAREKSFRDELFRFVNFYSAVCYAILALTISGFVSYFLQKGKISLIFLIGPIITLFICAMAIRVTRKNYRRIMEDTSTKIKLEHLLGLDCQLPLSYELSSSPIWPKDKGLLPPRHTERRYREDFSGDFIRDTASRGMYREIRYFFGVIIVLCLAMVFTFITLYFVLKLK